MSASPAAPPTVDLAAIPAVRADQRMLRVLGQQGFPEHELNGLIGVWTAERKAGEHLTQFLVREDVLLPAAPPILAMNWGEDLLLAGTEDLFVPEGLARLRKRLSEFRPASGGRADETVVPPSFSQLETSLEEPEPTTPTPPPAELTSGQLLGRCLITGRLAAGSYGIVYRALHRTLNIPVAVKVLHPDLIDSNAKAAAQFRTEAMLLARLNHPNIVRVWDFDDTVVPPYLVLEFVEGANVADMIQRRGLVRLDLAVRIVLQVVDGLEAAYQHGIVHRDIKPANILLTREENSKIADLGLAVVADRSRQIGHMPASTPHALAGTVAYLAPELAGGGGSVDHRSDIYSLGATFYHMVTGQLPFSGKSPLEVLLKHARMPVTPPHEVVREVDEGVSAIIVRMMAKNPTDRFRSYDELRDALIDADIAIHSQISGLSDQFDSAQKTDKMPPPPDPSPPARKRYGLFGWFRRS